ncbi:MULTISPECIES: branched-chain amino acid ABC transporter permease [unclassified Streptomyces]|uniref:branched-chain amino acid ABC transporter permease n=1 Tax=unclassified Streptomyces TaxID=2593676 RepID=UPI001BE5A87F|nr:MULTISPECIES: branched-chain amino acid ABC transporter permease [unclassified Streptomyces]MBT2402312.1 branched-chain amino acid ABC transporter permease [Streptomyces sp. ISL-21]MBT2458567.1 branched-chain amino acid ABC transporter permease [Streptomyces sp. ISL-86]MBT2606742.1 branched-chain amino acid ABC transporter permease [Streptomyces sp. ISL-87]
MTNEATTVETLAATNTAGPSRTALLYTIIGGSLIAVISTFFAWTYTTAFPGDLTIYGNPAPLQLLTLVGAVLTALYALSALGIKGLGWLTPAGARKALWLLALGTFATTLYTAGSIAWVLGGVVHLEPGAAIAVVGAAIPALAAYKLPDDTRKAAPAKKLPSWAEILIITAVFAVGLYVITFGIDTDDKEPQLFTAYLILVAFATTAIMKSGLSERLSAITANNRQITVIAGFVAALAFPLTQQGGDTYTLIAVNILIFATVALGLNVVVGLAGLLDLGYVAFLGVGAYTAALVSGSASSAFHVHFPFWAAVLAGALASLIFGVVIGAPTLRLRGDYLAIVTLGFGEIFRIAMGNLDGTSGPKITNGPNGVTNIPDLELFGWNFGQAHTVAGIELGAYANYYLLMLLAMALVVIVFSRAGSSRIGRAWVAIREDETAATAMGINGFRVKLIAFALGATLAGLAGTVQAHVQHTVVPEMYQFAGPVPPNSAFLLAAVILGGMGTIRGPLLGAALLFLIPAKLSFLQDYQLLGFGIALILLMRFRPEGLIANKRAQLEYHDDTADQAPTDLATAKAGA